MTTGSRTDKTWDNRGVVATSRRGRVARGLSAATLATFVALMSHLAAGGDVPGFAGIALPLTGAVLVSTILAGKRTSVLRLTLAVVASQLLFHTLFVLGASGGAMTMHTHHGHGVAISEATPAAAAIMNIPILTDPVMIAWHTAAAAITITGLLHGERAARASFSVLRSFRQWLRARLTLRWRDELPQHAPVAIASSHPPARTRGPMPPPRRGPPLSHAVA